ncbi:MAG TPA: FAD-dependent oxidoreductase [Candidatus Limnocylindria bacterium]
MGLDLVVIGGGIIGCSAAALAAERGASVTLVEATSIGAGASGRNLGALQHPFDPVLAPLFHDSLRRYRALEDAALSLPERPSGLLLLNASADAAAEQAGHLAAQVPELDPTFLEADAVARMEPSLVGGLAACRLETGFPIPPAAATQAWARLAQSRGVDFRVGLAAALAPGGVQLADGSRLAPDAVLVAAGPWTPDLLAPLGRSLPIVRTWGVTVQLRLGDAAPHHVVEEDEVDAVNRPAVAAGRARDASSRGDDVPSLFSLASAGGVTTLGSTFLPDQPDPQRVSRLLLERGAAFLPAIAGAEVVEVRVCARPQSIDGRPFIGPVPGLGGVHVCAGHGPWGISTGPASAALAVDALLDGARVPAALSAGRSSAVPARRSQMSI